MEKIFIRNLRASAVIGVLPRERRHRQPLLLDLELGCDGGKAARSDDLRDAVDYSAVERKVLETVEGSSFFLLEALAGAVGEAVLSFPLVHCVAVRITKPGASDRAEISYQAEFFRS